MVAPSSYEPVPGIYYIKVKSQSGDEVAVLDIYHASVEKRVNDMGSYSITIPNYSTDLSSSFELDSQIEFWRSIPGQVEWYLEFEGLHRKAIESISADGEKLFTSEGVGYNELLARKTVAYKAGTIRADKDDIPSETAMKQYVEENCGATADNTVVGRLYQGGFPNFTIETDSGAGKLWTGSKSGEIVLDVVKEIAVFSGIDFAVVGNGDGAFMFETYESQLGSDRTTIGLDPITGKNAAGNQPVIFAASYGNVEDLTYENTAFMLRSTMAYSFIKLPLGDILTKSRRLRLKKIMGKPAGTPETYKYKRKRPCKRGRF